jgi:hypothetical protein
VRRGASPAASVSNSLPGGHSEREPPDPIPNSEVKTLCADGSVPFRHARVGHCQALDEEPLLGNQQGFSFASVRGDRDAEVFAQHVDYGAGGLIADCFWVDTYAGELVEYVGGTRLLLPD